MKEIPNFPGYFVDLAGNIWTGLKCNGCKPRTNIGKPIRKLKPGKDTDGYLMVVLYKDNKKYTKKVHRLILETFVGPCPEGMECCHKNGIKDDNRWPENLRWDTQSNNNKDRIKHGMINRGSNGKLIGEKNPNSKLNKLKVRIIKYLLKYSDMTQKEIADIFNISRVTISNIDTKKCWKHL